MICITDDEDIKPEKIKVEPEIDTEAMECDDYQPLDSENDILVKKEEVKTEQEPQKTKKSTTWENDFKFEPKSRSRQKIERKFKCKKCGVSFQRERTLDNHQVYQHPETLTQEEIKAIKERDRESRIRICPQCGIATDQLQQHIRYVHEQVKRFFCDHCSYATFKKFNIRSHVLRHITLEKKFTCDVCGKKFSRKSAFNSHMRDFHENAGKTYACHCGREYNTHGKLWKHKKWKHMEDAKVPCPNCLKVLLDTKKKNFFA